MPVDPGVELPGTVPEEGGGAEPEASHGQAVVFLDVRVAAELPRSPLRTESFLGPSAASGKSRFHQNRLQIPKDLWA